MLADEAKRQIEQCENAKVMMANPIDVKIENLGLLCKELFDTFDDLPDDDKIEIYKILYNFL